MKKALSIVVTTSILSLSFNSLAADDALGIDIPGEFSMTATGLSDYTFRGITQSDEEPAIQGSLDYSAILGQASGNDIGFYAGIWASSVDFDDGDEASTEFNYYGGLTYEIEGFSIDVGGIYYVYPGASDSLNYDYWEAQAALGYDFGIASVGTSINYSPENFGDSGDASYVKASVDVPLPHSFALSGHVGRQNIEDNTAFGNPDYLDWGIGLSATIEGIDLGLQYVDTDIDESDCADGCDSRAIFSVSKTF